MSSTQPWGLVHPIAKSERKRKRGIEAGMVKDGEEEGMDDEGALCTMHVLDSALAKTHRAILLNLFVYEFHGELGSPWLE